MVTKNMKHKVAKKRVLITGADGFIGSHLTETLCKAGHNVTALAYYNSFNSWGWLETINNKKNLKIISGDIRDPGFCRNIVKGQDTVFNLAALIAIPYSYKAPHSYVDTNIKGTLNLCEAARDYNIKSFIQTSTSEVYGTAMYTPIDEKHPLQAQSPYSASKIGSDSVAMSFHYSFGLPVTIIRPFNAYGPRQSSRAIIPSIITQILSGKKTINLGDLSPTRDFTFVKDLCECILMVSENKNTVGKTINIGTGHEISIKHLVSEIKEIMASNVKIATQPERKRPKKSEVYRLCCDNTLLKKIINHSPQTSLKLGLSKTIEWFSDPANLNKYKSEIYNI